MRERTTWEALPQEFADWIQAQEGLRIRGEPISNREMLMTTACLLHWNCKSADEPFNPQTSSIMGLAMCVALRYIKGITRTTGKLMQTNTIPGRPGRVIQRDCFTCKKPALDDAFPHFLTEMQEVYVIKVHERSNCGRPDCQGKNSALIPIDPRQKHTRLRSREVKASARARCEISRITALLRSGTDLKNCPAEILVECPNKKCRHKRTHCGRWTINNPPKFLQPKLVCSVCKTRNAYFRAVDKGIPTITEAALYDVLNRFEKVGCNLMEFAKIPELIYSTAHSYEERFELLKKASDPSYVMKPMRKVGRKRKYGTTQPEDNTTVKTTESHHSTKQKN